MAVQTVTPIADKLAPDQQNSIIQEALKSTIGAQFPIVGKTQTLQLVGNLKVDDTLEAWDLPNQRELKLAGKSWHVPVVGDFKLIDNKTGQVVDTVKNLKVANIPKMTDRFSMLIDGNEYTTMNQFRLKPGIYTRKKTNDEMESQFNLAVGYNFKMEMDPADGIFYLYIANQKFHLYTLLHAFGIGDTAMSKVWGMAILEKNRSKGLNEEGKEIPLMIEKLKKVKLPYEKALNELKDYFDKTRIDVETTELTLGKGFDRVTPETLLFTSSKLLKVLRGEEKEDERDSLLFKELNTVDDLLGKYFEKKKPTIYRNLMSRTDSKSSIKEIISPDTYSKSIKEFFTSGDLSNPSPQTNPVEMLGEWRKTTVIGTGGIQSEHAITFKTRDVHPSHLGFLDPINSPESGRVGVTLALAKDVQKIGKDIVTDVTYPNGKEGHVTPIQFYKLRVGFPDQHINGKAKGKEVKAIHEGQSVILKPEEIDAYLTHPNTMFAWTTNLIPFLGNNSGNRALVAAKMVTQSMSLKERETPLVQVITESGQPFDTVLGNYLKPTMPIGDGSTGGVVEKVDENYVTVKSSKGVRTKIGLYNNFPLNQESFLHSTPNVKVGDTVKEGQTVGDTNFVDKSGQFAPGLNVNVAYMPWHGYNWEDGIVITDSLAKRFTSTVMLKKSLQIESDGIMDVKKFRAYYPQELTDANVAKLDENGVIKEGQTVSPGETLIAYLQPIDLTDTEKVLKQMNKILSRPFKNRSLVWDGEHEGHVTHVRKIGSTYNIYVKEDQPLVVGDKLSAKYGDKGIVTHIVPDNEAPHTKDGTRIDMMVNIHGVAGRMNMGQMLEAAAGKWASKTGNTYKVENFSGKDYLTDIMGKLKDANIPADEVLLDGKDGKPFRKPIFWGNKHYLKLMHVVDHKYKSRGLPGSYDVNEQPSHGETGGQSMDPLQMYAYLAHGAKCFSSNTLIATSDGPVRIEDIYTNNKKDYFVKSFDGENIVLNRVINRFKNSVKTEELLRVSSGNNMVVTTKGHEFFTQGMMKKPINDVSTVLVANTLSDEQLQIMLGSYLGDGSVSKHGVLCITHCEKQLEYLKWKQALLGGHLKGPFKNNGYSNSTEYKYSGKVTEYGRYLRKSGYAPKKRVIEDLHKLNAIGLAIWYQDDGNYYKDVDGHVTLRISSNSFTKEENTVLAQIVERITGAVWHVRKHGAYYILACSKKEDVQKFITAVSPYIHPSMGYKIGCDLVVVPKISATFTAPLVPTYVHKRPFKFAPSQKRCTFKCMYNIEVENVHNYFLSSGYLVGNSNLYEFTAVKGQKNDEYWRALQLGFPPPPPMRNFIFDKMLAHIQATGANVQKNGYKLKLYPATTKDVLKWSKGAIPDAGHALRGKDLMAIPGGLFDPKLTGGPKGTNWNHIDLNEEIPNPMYDKAISSLLKMTSTQYDKIINEDLVEEGLTGGELIKHKLASIDVDKDLTASKALLHKAPASQVNALNKRIRYLQVLKDYGMKPTEAYMMKALPVLPVVYRPVFALGSGDLKVSPINKHYHDVALLNSQIKSVGDMGLDREFNKVNRVSLYRSVESLLGFTDPLTHTNEKYEGLLATIAGRSPKQGMAQNKAWSKRQDLSARSTISTEPSLGMDEVGVPDSMLKDVFKPFIVREIVRQGITPMKALDEIEKWSPIADNALNNAIKQRPVLLNRAPSLHKHSVQALRPVRFSGSSIRVNPLIAKAFNYDVDGDYCINSVILYIEKPNIFKLAIDFATYFSYNKVVKQLRYNKLNKGAINIMAARYNITLPAKNGNFYIANLEDFPYDKNNLLGTKDHITFYGAVPGTKVIAYDEKLQKLVFTDVAGWSVHKDREVWTIDLSNNKQIISDDDERAVYGLLPNSLDFARRRPSESVGMLVPTATDIEEVHNKGFDTTEVPGIKDSKLLDTIKLTKEVGYVLGALVGDGWTDSVNEKHVRVILAGIEKPVTEQYTKFLTSVFKVPPHMGHAVGTASYGRSEKWLVSSADFATWVAPLIGKGAINKHLPPFWFNAPREFKIGLLSGLFDTDGCICVSNSKDKPQLVASFDSISLRLVQEVQQLLRVLGVNSTICFSKKTSVGNDFWHLGISSVGLQKIKDELIIAHEANKLALQTSVNIVSPSYARMDMVPITASIAGTYLKNIGFPGNASNAHKALYATVHKVQKTGKISRIKALELLEKYSEVVVPDTWKAIVKNTGVSWAEVVSVENTGKKETGYDLTVPGYETFMSIDGIILSNTMSLHVPISEKAVQEAYGMLPSKNLYKAGDKAHMINLDQDYQLGVYYLSVADRDSGKSFSSIEEAEKVIKDKQTSFLLNGVKLTLGQYYLNNVLPKELQDYTRPFDVKAVKKLMETLNDKYPNDFARIVDAWKELGRDYATERGSTISITDMVGSRKYRDDIVAKHEKHLKPGMTKFQIADIYEKAKAEVEDKQTELLAGKNNFYDMLRAGSTGKKGQITQILSMPGIFNNVHGVPIPYPVKKGWAEGLDTFDYWNQSYGARKGVVDRSVNTAESGALNKEILFNTKNLIVIEDDCNTPESIELPIDSKEIMDRYLATAIVGVGARNALVNHEVVAKAQHKKLPSLKVRSPLTCEAEGGVCVKCYGLMANGMPPRIGENVGVIDSQALSERSTQLTMVQFHTGGTATGSSNLIKGFPRLEQLLFVPQKIADKAVLAAEPGMVTSVASNPAGGTDMRVGANKYYIPRERTVLFKEGATVKKGDALTDGVMKPQELSELRDHLTAQQYMADEINNVYENKFARKTFETVLRGTSNNAELMEVPNHVERDWLRGDVVPLTTVNKLNREYKAAGKSLIEFKPIFKSIEVLPLESKDWLSRLTTNRIVQTIQDAAAQGQESNTKGTDPMTAYLAGTAFGQNLDPKKKAFY